MRRQLVAIAVLLVTLVGAPSVVDAPRASAGISAFSGHCELRLLVTREGRTLQFENFGAALCRTESGSIAEMTIVGSVGRSGDHPGFDCARGSGRGTVDLTISDGLRSFSADDLPVEVVFAAGVATMDLTNIEDGGDLVAEGGFVQPVTIIGTCIGELTTVTWLGVIEFSVPDLTVDL